MATSKTEGKLIPALERLRRLSLLEHDWDSYGGDPPTPAALDMAMRVVQDAAQTLADAIGRTSEPRVIVARGDGGVIMEWGSPTAALEVHVEPDGHLGYLLDKTIDGESRSTERDEASWPEIEIILADAIAS
jgi:hypothetical protein